MKHPGCAGASAEGRTIPGVAGKKFGFKNIPAFDCLLLSPQGSAFILSSNGFHHGLDSHLVNILLETVLHFQSVLRRNSQDPCAPTTGKAPDIKRTQGLVAVIYILASFPDSLPAPLVQLFISVSGLFAQPSLQLLQLCFGPDLLASRELG